MQLTLKCFRKNVRKREQEKENTSECKYLVNQGKGHIGVLCTIFVTLNLKLQQNLKVTKS